MSLAEPRYCISIDIDWAPDEVIEDTRQLIDQAGLPATFFATHAHQVPLDGHEIAVHPNFLKSLTEGRTIPEELQNIHRLFPQAKGVRAHSLCSSTRFYPSLAERGLRYDSSFLCYGQHDLRPFWMINQIVQLPIFFEDDLHMELANQLGHPLFSLPPLELAKPGLKVLVFHPIHLFLNTDSLARYEQAKKYYHQPLLLEPYRNPDRGIRNLFLETLEFLASRPEQVVTMLAAAETWRAQQSEVPS